MRKQFVIVLCLLMVIGISYAQNNDNSIQKFKNAFQSESFQLSGFGHIQYHVSEYPERSFAPGKANNSIDIIRAMVIANGKLGANNQYGYALVYDFGPGARLIEYYGDWSLSKAANIRIGQYKTPFTIENPVSLSRIETINLSRPVLAMNGNTGDFNQWEADGRVIAKTGRDIGVQLSGFLFPAGDFFRIEYYAGLFNGSGINTRDNNNHKDFVGTAYFYPAKEVKLGGSVYLGEHPQYMQIHLPGNNLTNRRWAIGAEYRGDKFYGRTEYIAANDGDLKRAGYYGLLVWKPVPDQWEIVGKYDYYNKDTQDDNSEIRDFTFGINYTFAYLSRIQLNYIYSDNKIDGNNNAFAIQLQLFF